MLRAAWKPCAAVAEIPLWGAGVSLRSGSMASVRQRIRTRAYAKRTDLYKPPQHAGTLKRSGQPTPPPPPSPPPSAATVPKPQRASVKYRFFRWLLRNGLVKVQLLYHVIYGGLTAPCFCQFCSFFFGVLARAPGVAFLRFVAGKLATGPPALKAISVVLFSLIGWTAVSNEGIPAPLPAPPPAELPSSATVEKEREIPIPKGWKHKCSHTNCPSIHPSHSHGVPVAGTWATCAAMWSVPTWCAWCAGTTARAWWTMWRPPHAPQPYPPQHTLLAGLCGGHHMRPSFSDLTDSHPLCP